MTKPSPWRLVVQRSERLSPHMQRITFGGSGLSGFPQDSDTAYLKVSFPVPKGARQGLRRRVGAMLGRDAFAVRSYTVRRYDAISGELDIDFVLHGDHGIASSWASTARVGDVLFAGGPGPKKLLNVAGDWFLVAGDLSALPAISANLARLPESAIGYAVIEIPGEADRQTLEAPAGIDIHWVVNAEPRNSAEVMMTKLRSLDWLDGRCEAWVAGELGAVRAVRSWLRNERKLGREQMYASSYWQLGSTDEQHRVAKKLDQEKAAVG